MNEPEDNPFRDNGDNEASEPANPFHSPPDVRGSELDLPAGADAMVARSPGIVRQVRPVAICMIIHGILIGIMGLFVVGMAFFFANMNQFMPPEETEAMAPMQVAIGWGYGIFGSIIVLVGALTIYAGIRNLAFRGRTFGIVMLGVGIIMILTCYCAPTSIGLAVWGLIVYLNPSVARAFAMTSDGTSVEEILAMVRKPGT